MINTLGLDPTRSIMLRIKFSADMARRFNQLKAKVTQLLVTDDALRVKISKDPFISVTSPSPLFNAGWEFLDTAAKVESFKKWLRNHIAVGILEKHKEKTPEQWLQAYINAGFKKGAARSFDDVRKTWSQTKDEFKAGAKDEFLRSTLNHPVSIDRVKVLVTRSYNELEGITEAMSNELTKEFTDGLIQGLSPRDVARRINRRIDKISRNSALAMARTDIVRAHAEGQLYALERLGLDRVGVSVEWSTSGHSVCELCSSMNKVVLKLSEAHGMIPRHRNCKCAFIPAGVGEDDSGQIKTKSRILGAIDASLRAEGPKYLKTDAARRAHSSWAGATKKISKKRTKPIL